MRLSSKHIPGVQETHKQIPFQEQRRRLFIAARKPVTSATIGHWLKNFTEQSGIDTSIFMAHSTRGAATFKASAEQGRRKRSGWSGFGQTNI